MTLIEKLRKIRLNMCVSQRVLGNQLGLSNTAVWFYESGNRVPNYEARKKYLKLAAQYNVDLKPQDFQ